MKYEDIKVLDSEIIMNDYVKNEVKPRHTRRKLKNPLKFKRVEFNRINAIILALAVGIAVSIGCLVAQAIKYANVLEGAKLISTIL